MKTDLIRAIRSVLLPLLLLLPGGACSRRGETGAPVPTVEIALTLDLAIGDESGSDAYTFAYVNRVLTDATGRIYVDCNPVRVYGPEGTFLRALGGEGDGPGEMRFPGDAHVWPDGTVDVLGIDGRWLRWDVSGGLLFDHRPRDFIAALNTDRLPTREGAVSYAYKSPWSVTRSDTASGYWVQRCDEDLRATGVAACFPPGRPTAILNQDFEGHRLGSVLPFALNHMIRTRPQGGYVFARCDSALVQWFSEEFELQRVTHWETVPEPLTEADYVAYHRSREDGYRGAKDAAWREHNDRMLRFILSQDLPETKPVIADVLVALDGRLWVEQWGERQESWNADPDTPYRYWVIGPDGKVEFECSLPFAPTAATGDFLFQGFSDGEHTPQARRYRWQVIR